MKVKIYPDYATLSSAVADIIAEYIAAKKNVVVCLASGHTPLGVFECLIEKIKIQSLNIDDCIFLSLDEWIGIPAAYKGSCRNMMDEFFFRPLNISMEKIRFFDGMSPAPESEARQMNAFIRKNGLDIMLVGIGLNGHIAMNEPGTSFNSTAHVSNLTDETKSVGQKYFPEETILSRGITLGLKHLKQSSLPILMASGLKKASIIKKALSDTPDENVPASIMQLIPHGLVALDVEASSELHPSQIISKDS